MGRLRPEDFAALKISWEPKANGIEQILKTVNLTPRSVLFIDDNPVERAAIEGAFPGIRTLGSNPLLWRRILLWSAETQVARLSTEAATRTEMVRAQIVREEQRQQLGRDDFLKTLDLKVSLSEIVDTDSDEFARAVELLNRTNQFNTTGVRRSEQECREALRAGKRLFTLRASDRFTNYGLVGIIITEGSHIEQFAMSCRVIALDVEVAAMSALLELFGESGRKSAVGTIVETPLNSVVRDLFDRCGFVGANGRWERPLAQALCVPAHVRLTKSWETAPKSGDSLPA
jgi:FkbH-like protein